MFKKYLMSFLVLFIGLVGIHFLKNETREIEIGIEKVSKNIIFLQENFETQKIEYSYLSSPERISNLASKYLSNNYIFIIPKKKLNEKK